MKGRKNTCKPRSAKRFIKALSGIEKHVENHPNDAMSRTRISKLKSILKSMGYE